MEGILRVANELADYVVGLSQGNLPTGVLHQAKQVILDSRARYCPKIFSPKGRD